MKFIDMSKATKPGKMNLIALLFALIAITGIFLTIDRNQTTREREEKVQKLKEIAADTSLKNIHVEYKEADPGEFQGSKDLSDISGYTNKFFQSMLTVIILLFIFLFIMYLIKRKNKKSFGGNNNIKIIERKYLGQKQYLAIVIVDEEKLLLGVTDQSINCIKKLKYAPDENHSDERSKDQENKETFPKILGRLKHNQNEN